MKKRNPLAKELRTPKYRPRVVRDRKTYTRKTKHKNG
jgi:hypothetical protein